VSSEADRRPASVYARLRTVPPGRVVSYGDLCPGAPRHAGRLLARAPAGLPWWRVVRADGSLARGEEQLRRLAAEGTPLRDGRVLMAQARLPAEALSAMRAEGS
jgi:methylated-DNA-protein-cysteine methyltransferase-like protein